MDESIPMEVFEDPDEVNDLEALQLPRQVISDLAEKRKRYESKLVASCLEDYIEYIETEKRLLELVSCGDKFPQKRKIMETRLTKKIGRLFKEAINKFPNDYQLLMDYFQFLKEMEATVSAKEIIEIILQKHPQKEEVWLTAIDWYIQTHSSESTIRKTISKALLHHPSSKEIFIEVFTFVLTNIENSIKQNSNPSNSFLEYFKECVDLFFKNTHKNVKRYFDVLEKFDNFEHATDAKEYFLEKITEICGTKIAFWENLAKRHSKGVEDKLNECFAIYEKGINSLPESKKSGLWRLYLKFLLKICSYNKTAEIMPTMEHLKFANEKFEQAHLGDYLTDDQYLLWLELDKKIESYNALTEFKDSMNVFDINFEILEKGLQACPKSVILWKTYFKAYISHNNSYKGITDLFERAITVLKEDCSELWMIFLSYCEQTEKIEYTNTMYLKAIENPQVVSAVAAKYLRFAYVNYDIKKCRNTYDLFLTQKTSCKDIHRTMLQLEFLEFKDNTENWEKVYKNFLEQFPHDVDVWVDYIQFHKRYKKSSEETISALYERATNALPDSLQLLLRVRLSETNVL